MVARAQNILFILEEELQVDLEYSLEQTHVCPLI